MKLPAWSHFSSILPKRFLKMANVVQAVHVVHKLDSTVNAC